jgi:folylpolyglutamate synthase
VQKIKLGIPGKVQQSNASLSLAIIEEHLRDLKLPVPDLSSPSLPPEIIAGLETARWPGRCETRIEDKVTWYCDGAHTAESITAATQWYSSMYPDGDLSNIVQETRKRQESYCSISKLAMQLAY